MMNEDEIVKIMVDFIEQKEKELHNAKMRNINITTMKSNFINAIVAKIEKETQDENI